MQIKEYLADQDYAPTTKRDYEGDLKRFQAWAQVDEPDPATVKAYRLHLEELGRSSSHISRTLYALAGYCEWQGLEVFAKGKEKSKDRVRMPSLEFNSVQDTITDADVAKLIEVSETPLEKCIVALLADSAIRIGELLKLQIQDVDWEEGVLQVHGKGMGKIQTPVAIFPETLEILKEYKRWRKLQKFGPLFPYEYRDLRHYLLKLAKRAGVEFPKNSKFHAFRHYRALSLRANLGDQALPLISDHLRHKTASITHKLYSRFSPEQVRERLSPPAWAQDKSPKVKKGE